MWLPARLKILFVLTSATWIEAQTDVVDDEYLQSTTDAPSPCQLLEPTKVVCDGIQSLDEVPTSIPEDAWSQVTTLSIENSEMQIMTLDDLVDLPSLHTIAFNRSLVTSWIVPANHDVPTIKHFILQECWDSEALSSAEDDLTITITRKMMAGLVGLQEIRLIDCLILNVEFSVLEEEKALKLLQIDGGSLICKTGNLWMLFWMESEQISISETTTCFKHDTNIMLGFNGHPFKLVMGYIKEAQRDCPRPCSCDVRAIKSNGYPLQYAFCEGRGLTELPPKIPRFTSQLYLTDNNITDIDTLFTSDSYRRIDSVHLKNNHISSINGELFYDYIHNRTLEVHINLMNNRLKTIPVWALTKVHEYARNISFNFFGLIRLRDNPWDCDNCSFINEFRAFYRELIRHKSVDLLDDADDIRCGPSTQDAEKEEGGEEEGDEGIEGMVILMTEPDNLCPPEGASVLKNAVYTTMVVALLVFVLGLSYFVRLRKRQEPFFELLK